MLYAGELRTEPKSLENLGLDGMSPIDSCGGGGLGLDSLCKPCCIEGGDAAELPKLVCGGFLETPEIPDP